MARLDQEVGESRPLFKSGLVKFRFLFIGHRFLVVLVRRYFGRVTGRGDTRLIPMATPTSTPTAPVHAAYTRTRF